MKLGYDLFIWKNYAVKQAININLKTHPMMLVTGYSGSGKSYFLKYYIRNLLNEYDNVDFHFLNYKNSKDFSFLKSTQNYACFEECQEALEEFYSLYKSRQGSDIEFDGTFRICVFDEVAAFLQARPTKKVMEQDMRYMSEIVAMGRSYGICLVLSMQRPDASLFSNGGVRENMHVKITFGNQSTDGMRMLYSGFDLPKDEVYNAGEGVVLVDGRNVQEIKVPRIKDIDSMERDILQNLKK